MSIQFPDTPPPTDGQIASINGQTWRYRSDINAWEKVSGALYAITGLLGVGASITLTGDGTLASPYVVGTTVIPDYIGPQLLAYVGSTNEVIFDMANGRQAWLTLTKNTTLTIRNLAPGEEAQVIVYQDEDGPWSLSIFDEEEEASAGSTADIANMDELSVGSVTLLRIQGVLISVTNANLGAVSGT
jgi:hypothetical protein